MKFKISNSKCKIKSPTLFREKTFSSDKHGQNEVKTFLFKMSMSGSRCNNHAVFNKFNNLIF